MPTVPTTATAMVPASAIEHIASFLMAQKTGKIVFNVKNGRIMGGWYEDHFHVLEDKDQEEGVPRLTDAKERG